MFGVREIFRRSRLRRKRESNRALEVKALPKRIWLNSELTQNQNSDSHCGDPLIFAANNLVPIFLVYVLLCVCFSIGLDCRCGGNDANLKNVIQCV